MKADELSIKGGFTMRFELILVLQLIRNRFSVSQMQNLNQYHQTIREMKNAQQMVLGTISFQYFDHFQNISVKLNDQNKVKWDTSS